MKKTTFIILIIVLLQTLSTAQFHTIDSLLFQNLNTKLFSINKSILIDFSFDRSDQEDRINLTKDEKKIHTIIAYLLKNKFVTLEIGVHTDCQGNLIYNEKTSEQRAQYLVNEILSSADSIHFSDLKNRIIPKGYGEFYLLEKCKCSECTNDQHQTNNRVVLKLIKNDIPISSQALRGRGGRGPSFDPEVQVKGKITLKVCVDENGMVIKSKTVNIPQETTILNQEVIAQAIEAANKWKFKPSKEKVACGTITYVIKLKPE